MIRHAVHPILTSKFCRIVAPSPCSHRNSIKSCTRKINIKITNFYWMRQDLISPYFLLYIYHCTFSVYERPTFSSIHLTKRTSGHCVGTFVDANSTPAKRGLSLLSTFVSFSLFGFRWLNRLSPVLPSSCQTHGHLFGLGMARFSHMWPMACVKEKPSQKSESEQDEEPNPISRNIK
jgi:hypothetical protein